MELSRQDYWSGLPFPSPGGLPNPGIESRSIWVLLCGEILYCLSHQRNTCIYIFAFKINGRSLKTDEIKIPNATPILAYIWKPMVFVTISLQGKQSQENCLDAWCFASTIFPLFRNYGIWSLGVGLQINFIFWLILIADLVSLKGWGLVITSLELDQVLTCSR